MKRGKYLLLLLLAMLLLPAAAGFAQAPGGELESLQVRFWPDFDDPSVLVLLNGQLPEETILPAEVTIPIPEGAEINAIAQISGDDMLSLEFESVNGAVTFLTPSPRFLVEYYAPYQQDGRTRSYDFEWESDMSVAQLLVEVQQPASALSISTEPAATNVFTSQVDGLNYHGLDPQTVPAGMPYQLSFNYDMTSDELTVGPVSSAPPETADPVAAPVEEGDNNQLLFFGLAGLAGLVLAVVVTWLVATRGSGRKSNRPLKPKPKARSTTKKSVVVYCHNCGQPSEGNDRFCRQCGTELKRP